MSRFLLKSCLTVLVVASLVSLSRAQDDDKIIRPSTKAGSAAWEFSFAGLSTLGMASMPIASVNEGGTPVGVVGAGYKYYLSDDMALRAMLGFSTSSDGDEDVTKSASGKTTNTSYGIAVGVEMHTHAVYSTSPYFGAQLAFGGASTDNKRTSGGNTTENKGSGTTFGIGVLAGFDWYFTHGLAVGAEYMLGFNSMSSSTTTSSGSTSTTTDAPSSTAIGISNAGNVHLVVHF
jgi:hypothetical protein